MQVRAFPPFYILHCVLLLLLLLETHWLENAQANAESSSACVEAVLKGVFMSVPSPSEVLREPRGRQKTDCENTR